MAISHLTEKPDGLARRAISSLTGERVLDLFGGTVYPGPTACGSDLTDDPLPECDYSACGG